MKSGLRRLAAQVSSKPPVPLAPAGAPGNRGMIFDLGSGSASVEAALNTYKTSGTIHSIVSLLAEASASPKWHLYKKQPVDGRVRYSTGDQGSDQRTEVVQHAAIQLWCNPNTFHSGFEFREGSQQHAELTGMTFWVLDYAGVNFPTSMWYVRPDRMTPVPSATDFLAGWLYTSFSGEVIPLQLNEVIMERNPDPLDQYMGTGPVQSIMPNIDQMRYATQYQRNLFLNGAEPGGIIQAPEALTDREFAELVDRWRESHQGVARAGRVGVLENGMTWVPSGQTNKDLEYGNLRLANRDEMREAWRIHKSMLGTSDDVNRANAETAQEIFDTTLVVPRLNRRRDTLNCKLLPLFGSSGQGVEFDYENPVQENREQALLELQGKAEAAFNLISAGYDPDDVCETVGLPEMGHAVQAAQAPALPPRWVAVPPAAGGGAAAPAALPPGTHPATEPQDAKPTARERIVIHAKDVGSEVFAQQAKDYPADAMAWMHHADWKGPVQVPIDHIQPNMRWLDTTTQDHVEDFVKKIKKGKALKPVILVKTPGDPDLQLIDGHHRYLADAQEKQPVLAYIGTVDQDHGGWETMHDYQFDRPAKAKNVDQFELLAQMLQENLRPYSDRALPANLLNKKRR